MLQKFSLVLLLFILSFAGAAANSDWQSSENIKARIVEAENKIGIEIEAAEGWHYYYKNPGDAGYATDFDFTGSKNFAVQEVTFPQYEVINEYGFKVNAYKGLQYFPINAKIGDNAKINLSIHGSVCKDICIPFELKFANVGIGVNTSSEAGISFGKNPTILDVCIIISEIWNSMKVNTIICSYTLV